MELIITVHSDVEVWVNLVQKRLTSVHDLSRYKVGLNPWGSDSIYYKYRDTI